MTRIEKLRDRAHVARRPALLGVGTFSMEQVTFLLISNWEVTRGREWGREIALGRVMGTYKGPGVRVCGRVQITNKGKSFKGHLDSIEQKTEMDGASGKGRGHRAWSSDQKEGVTFPLRKAKDIYQTPSGSVPPASSCQL